MKQILLLSLLAVLLSTASLGSTRSVTVRPFDVFVEPGSRYAFIRLPQEWKFVGKLSAGDMHKLPPQVLTSLVRRDDDKQRRE